MNKDLVTITNENNEKHDYKLLMVIDKDFKYLIYTDLDNPDYKKNLYAVKVKSINNNEETIPITDSEWEMIENEYKKIVNN